METKTTEQKREEAYQDVKMYIANDWDLKEETPEFFLLTRNQQSILIQIFLALCFWWLAFIPNIAYYFLKNEKKKILK
jgi:hypothetical protein